MPQYEISELEISCHVIESVCGIQLTWSEKIALNQYLRHFSDEVINRNNNPISAQSEVIFRFLYDYFDLDSRELDVHEYPEYAGGGEYGSPFFRTPKFIQHCKDNISMWRDERELI